VKKPRNELVKNIRYILPAIILAISAVAFADLVIPPDDIELEQILFGNPASFSKPAEIDVEALTLATPEFEEIKRKKIKKGTGKYWILRSNATDRAHRAIQVVVEKTDYDLITTEGYLGDLPTPIECDNITKQAMKIVQRG
jgi:hypothetical protein